MTEKKEAPGQTDATNEIENMEPIKDTKISIANISEEIEQKLSEITKTEELFTEITGEYLLNHKAEQMATLVDPFLPKVGIVCLAGGSDTGKSCLLRQLAINIVGGSSDFLGFPLNAQHKSVIFAATEDDDNATSFLLGKQAQSYESNQLKDLRFIFDTENLLDNLHQRLTKKPADLVIIDCFADVFARDLMNTQKIRTYLHEYQQLAVEHQCLIIFLHHTGKRTENFEPSKNNLLSGQGFEAKLRMVMELRVDMMDPHTRHLCIVKGNYLPSCYKKESFVLHFNESEFTFSNTGERTPFEFLVRRQEDSGKEKYNVAKALHENGFNYEQIAERIGFQSKGTVSKLFAKAKENGWN